MKTLLKNAKLLDANYSGEMLDVLVEDKKILAIGKNLEAEDVIDLSGCTLLPGFIDAHVHVAVNEGKFTDDAIRAWVWNGVTSVRELGMLSTLPMEDYAAWLKEVNENPGYARVVATGKYIDIQGGYGCGPEPSKVVGNVVSSVEEAEAMVEKAHELGFPGIKIGISDGMPGAPRMSDEMIKAICGKCKELGMWTACHIGLSETLQTMVSCGITETGHTPGDEMPQSLIEEMVKKGVAMNTTVGDPDKEMGPPPGMMEKMMGGPGPMGTPTEPSGAGPLGRGRAREQAEFSAFDGNEDERTLRGRGGPGGPGGMPGGPGGPGGMMFDPKAMAEKKKQQAKFMRENLRRFYEAGGKIAIGTDLIHSSDYMKEATIPTVELRHLYEVGLPFREVIKTGTIYPAELIGTAAEEGTIEEGKLANLIAVPGQVDGTFKALENVPFVMHYGTVVKNQL